jgi:hypothetical protein
MQALLHGKRGRSTGSGSTLSPPTGQNLTAFRRSRALPSMMRGW